MIKLALQIPKRYLKDFSVLTDFDFALAHQVLEDETYRNFYRFQRLRGREVWLDNSLIELGFPTSEADLIKAANMINATHVVAPDIFEDPIWSMEQAIQFRIRWGHVFKIVGCCHGDEIQQKNISDLYQAHDIIPALCYRNNRRWYNSDLHGPAHFLGFGNWREILIAKPTSIDTDFPIRCAVNNIEMSHVHRNDIEILPPIDSDIELSETQLKLVLWNIWKLKVSLT